MNKRNTKALITIILSLCFIPSFLYAIDLDFNWDAGDIFVNGEMKIQKDVDFLLNAGSRVGEVTFTERDTGLRLTYNPFYWNCETHFNPNNVKNRFSFINFELFYDFFHFDKTSNVLGLYTQVNYLDLINMSFSSYQVDVGVLYQYYPKVSNNFFFKPESVSVRSGFRMKDNIPSIYIESSFNLAGFILGILSDSYSDAQSLKDTL